ncbi:hypothetical protein SLS56_008449 [Neofusicoccum ribis]|uniref:Major facilitator superfamily (MFS) profile domain-containing protein n=1 Tax=Neofusicoccum ribis TaxID=45134 RepID=A0ABR3SK56_9PEZI
MSFLFYIFDKRSQRRVLISYGLIACCAIACIAGFLFGYDSGILTTAGGVLTLTSFQDHFDFTKAQKTHVSSLCVSLQQLGAFVACPVSIPISRKYGRKTAILWGSVVFCIGAMLQTVPSGSLPCFYVGRVIAGLGLGTMTVVVPQYNAEMSPKELRGRLGSFFQMAFTLGIFTSYWVDYGVQVNMGNSNSQWQIPVGMQILFSGLLALGMFTVKESPRWLAKKDRGEEALANLQWIQFLEKPVLKSMIAGFILFMAQQATGATAFAYYSPQYFSVLVGDNETRSLLLSGIFGAVKVAACFLFVILAADRFSRKLNLSVGAFGMAATQIVTAIVLKLKPVSSDAAQSVPPNAKATVAMIYLFVIVYNFSWGPLPWPYCNEFFSNRYREAGVALAVSSQWLFNFVFTISTPYMIDSMGWGTFLLWGLFDIVIGIFTVLFARETRGLSLEKSGQPDVFKDDSESKLNDLRRSSSASDHNKTPAQVNETAAN